MSAFLIGLGMMGWAAVIIAVVGSFTDILTSHNVPVAISTLAFILCLLTLGVLMILYGCGVPQPWRAA